MTVENSKNRAGLPENPGVNNAGQQHTDRTSLSDLDLRVHLRPTRRHLVK